ncbi:MAG: hypothetical protein ABI151_08080, partial [Chitinophagaceae bacterium]
MKLLPLQIFTALMLFGHAACNNPQQTKKIDRSILTDEQKRLPENAVGAFKVADGLELSLFASEPMMTNPTNMDIDSRGRVWITEGYNYR